MVRIPEVRTLGRVGLNPVAQPAQTADLTTARHFQQLAEIGEFVVKRRRANQKREAETQLLESTSGIASDVFSDPSINPADAPSEFQLRFDRETQRVANALDDPIVRAAIKQESRRMLAEKLPTVRNTAFKRQSKATQDAVDEQAELLREEFANAIPAAQPHVERRIRENLEGLRSIGLTAEQIQARLGEELRESRERRVQQLINLKDANAAERELNRFHKDIDADTEFTLRGRIDDLRDGLGQQAKAALRRSVNGELEFMLTRGRKSPTFREVREAAQVAGESNFVTELDDTASATNDFHELIRMPPEDANTEIRTRQRNVDDTQANTRLNIATKMYGQFQRDFTDDPYGTATSVGLIDVPPRTVDFTGDAFVEELSARMSAAMAVENQRLLRRGTVVPLLKEEKEQLEAILTESPISEARRVMNGLSTALGVPHTQMLAGSLVEDQPHLAVAIDAVNDGDENTANLILRGRNTLTPDSRIELPREQVASALRETLGGLFNVTPRYREAVIAAADVIYAQLQTDAGGQTEFNPSRYRKALRLAAGAKLTESGEIVGGPFVMNGQLTIPPKRGVTGGQVRGVLQVSDNSALSAPGISNGQPMKPAVNEQGEFVLVPMDGRDVARMNLLALGGGLYKVKDRNNASVRTETGDEFIFNLRRLVEVSPNAPRIPFDAELPRSALGGIPEEAFVGAP